jgi:hypothetical protein
LNNPSFDRYQFDGTRRREYPASAKYRLSFQDYSAMQTQQHKQSGERRLPTPAWALSDKLLAEIIVLFMEKRLYIRDPQGSLIERRERARAVAIAQIPRLNATIDKLNFEYVTAQRSGAPQHRLKELEVEIESLDTQIRTTSNDGGIGTLAAIAYLYYRRRLDSVGVGEALRIKPPHVRQILYRFNQLWAERFNPDGSPKPLAAHVDWDIKEAIAMRMAGLTFLQIGKELNVSAATIYNAFRKYGIVVPIFVFNKPRAVRNPSTGRSFDYDHAAEMRRAGMTYRQIANELVVKRVTVYHALRRIGETGRKKGWNQRGSVPALPCLEPTCALLQARYPAFLAAQSASAAITVLPGLSALIAIV